MAFSGDISSLVIGHGAFEPEASKPKRKLPTTLSIKMLPFVSPDRIFPNAFATRYDRAGNEAAGVCTAAATHPELSKLDKKLLGSLFAEVISKSNLPLTDDSVLYGIFKPVNNVISRILNDEFDVPDALDNWQRQFKRDAVPHPIVLDEFYPGSPWFVAYETSGMSHCDWIQSIAFDLKLAYAIVHPPVGKSNPFPEVCSGYVPVFNDAVDIFITKVLHYLYQSRLYLLSIVTIDKRATVDAVEMLIESHDIVTAKIIGLVHLRAHAKTPFRDRPSWMQPDAGTFGAELKLRQLCVQYGVLESFHHTIELFPVHPRKLLNCFI